MFRNKPTVRGAFDLGAIVNLTLVKIGIYMSKSSIDYSELAGLATALSRLSCKDNISIEEGIVMSWLNTRINELRSK